MLRDNYFYDKRIKKVAFYHENWWLTSRLKTLSCK